MRARLREAGRAGLGLGHGGGEVVPGAAWVGAAPASGSVGVRTRERDGALQQSAANVWSTVSLSFFFSAPTKSMQA